MTTSPREYQTRQAELAERAETTVLTVAAGSTLSGFTLASSLGVFLATVNDAATRLADAWTSAYLFRPALGLGMAAGEPDRLTAAIVSILEDQRRDALPRLGRIARSEPVNAARQTAQQVMKTYDVTRMAWFNDPNPCPICIDLASRTYAVDDLPETHPNCECIPIPVRTRRKAPAA